MRSRGTEAPARAQRKVTIFESSVIWPAGVFTVEKSVAFKFESSGKEYLSYSWRQSQVKECSPCGVVYV